MAEEIPASAEEQRVPRVAAPVVFLSAATLDLKPWRDHLDEAFARAGFRVLTQDRSMRSAPGDVRRLLAETVDEADCVVHLAGMAYGSDATDAFPSAPGFQCSWTQFEYYHAHEKKKDVIAFVCAPDLSAPFVEKADGPDDPARKQKLQVAHRERVAKGTFIGTPLEKQFTAADGTPLRTSNETVSNPGKLLSAVAAAIGTLHTIDREHRERVQREVVSFGAKLGCLHIKLTVAITFLAIMGFTMWMVKRDTHDFAAGQQQSAKRETDLAAQLSQVQEALSRIQQTTDPKRDPISGWPQERLETELAGQMKIEVKDLRAILVAGKTSLDALLQGQALLASGKPTEAGEKFDVVIQQDKDAMTRLRQAYEGKAQIAFDAVKYEEALAFREKAAALVDKTADPIGWAYAQGWVTFIDLHLARYQHAEPLMKEVVRLREESLGPDDPELATALNNLAELNKATNRLAEAEPLMEWALKIDEKSYGPVHPEVATDLNNLAQLYQTTNRLAEAEPLLVRVVKILENKGGEPLPNFASALNNLAQLYQGTNRLAEAEPLMERALKIDEKSFGPEHPEVATDLNNLAQLYKATNRLAEAEPLMERALKIDEKSFGPEHPKVATHLNNLAILYQSTNRLAQAEPLMKRVTSIFEKSYGSEHPNVATSVNNLAQLYKATNRLAEAEPLMERALKIDEKSFGPEHPEVATDLNNLAGLYQVTNRLTEAEPLMERALKIDEKSFGPEHPKVAIRLNNLGQLYQATNRLAEADPLMRRAVVILLKATRAAGHTLPNLEPVLSHYKTLLGKMSLPEAEIAKRVAAAGREAGYKDDEFAALLAPMFGGPFDVAVTEVVPEGQGPVLGIRVGDVVRRYNGQEITKVADLVKLTGESKGDAIPLEIQRGDETLKFTAKPGRLGLALEDRPKPTAKQ
jgi:tetratricopeptide (TPR) repeat protein